jgi:hypothetical protein
MEYRWKPAGGNQKKIKYCRIRSKKLSSSPTKSTVKKRSNEDFDFSEQYSQIEEEDVNFIIPSGGFLDWRDSDEVNKASIDIKILPSLNNHRILIVDDQ